MSAGQVVDDDGKVYRMKPGTCSECGAVTFYGAPLEEGEELLCARCAERLSPEGGEG